MKQFAEILIDSTITNADITHKPQHLFNTWIKEYFLQERYATQLCIRKIHNGVIHLEAPRELLLRITHERYEIIKLINKHLGQQTINTIKIYPVRMQQQKNHTI